jgi:DNA-directed RNA polymerase subunit RPC12/RpoP
MLSYKEISTLSSEQSKCKKICSYCGSRRLLGMQDKVVCKECNHYIFKDGRTEFKHRLKEEMIKEKRQK